MRLLHRHDEDIHRPDPDRDDAVVTGHERDRGSVDDNPQHQLEREETVDTRTTRWDIGSMLATAAGVALIVIGAVALTRTGINSTWYQPVEQVLGMDHTPLLGAVEVGVGALLVLAGLAGARMLAALVAVVAGTAATVAAIEPEVADRELAIEQVWAIALAVAAFAARGRADRDPGAPPRPAHGTTVGPYRLTRRASNAVSAPGAWGRGLPAAGGTPTGVPPTGVPGSRNRTTDRRGERVRDRCKTSVEGVPWTRTRCGTA